MCTVRVPRDQEWKILIFQTTASQVPRGQCLRYKTCTKVQKQKSCVHFSIVLLKLRSIPRNFFLQFHDIFGLAVVRISAFCCVIVIWYNQFYYYQAALLQCSTHEHEAMNLVLVICIEYVAVSMLFACNCFCACYFNKYSHLLYTLYYNDYIISKSQVSANNISVSYVNY
jgi:hypothetical protein